MIDLLFLLFIGLLFVTPTVVMGYRTHRMLEGRHGKEDL